MTFSLSVVSAFALVVYEDASEAVLTVGKKLPHHLLWVILTVHLQSCTCPVWLNGDLTFETLKYQMRTRSLTGASTVSRHWAIAAPPTLHSDGRNILVVLARLMIPVEILLVLRGWSCK